MAKSYQESFLCKYKKCKSKKDYKKLCKDMLFQYKVIDGVDANLYKILSEMIGEDSYYEVLAMAIKMYILDSRGIPYEMIPIDISQDMGQDI